MSYRLNAEQLRQERRDEADGMAQRWDDREEREYVKRENERVELEQQPQATKKEGES